MIAAAKNAAAPRIPNGKREFAQKISGAVFAPFPVCRHNEFMIGRSSSGRRPVQPAAQFGPIVKTNIAYDRKFAALRQRARAAIIGLRDQFVRFTPEPGGRLPEP